MTAAVVSQTVVTTFPAAADTRVHEATPTTNYGTRAVLRVDGATDPDIDTYLRFAVSGLTGTVQRATLRLHAITDTSDGPAVSGTGNDWVETALNWSNRPGPTTPFVADVGAVATGSWAEFDVTSLVAGNGAVNFLLTATSTNGVDFDSRESTTTFRPELVVETLTTGAPVATSPPTVSGAAQEGQTLTSTLGTWNGTQPITFVRQWQRCDAAGASCGDLPNETAASYLVQNGDVGATLRVVVTATNDDGSSAAASNPTEVVLAAGDIVIATAGDIASCTSSGDEATAALLDTLDPLRILTLGDHAYENGTDAEFSACYDPTWGRHKTKTHPSPGNHEYNTPGAVGYYNYFGVAAGDPAKGYYAFDLGSWRMYALNSNCTEAGGCGVGSPQEQWLRGDLATHPASCRAAFMHHLRFSSGDILNRRDNTSTAPLYQAFYEASGDLWLAGHNHFYERLTRLDPAGAINLAQGIRNFVVGTGGVGFGAFGIPTRGSEARSATFGVLRLTLRDSGYDWQFVPVAGSQFTDAGTDTCGAAPADATNPTAPTGLTSTTAGAASVRLIWNMAGDNLGVVAYEVYRDGNLLGETTETVFTDTTAVAGATYAYTVKARDAAGNLSDPSQALVVTVASATSLTFAAAADARVMEAKPTRNVGRTIFLRTDGGTDPDIESFLQFAVTGGTGPVQSATLRVYAFEGTTDGPSVYGAENGWTERGVTWNNRPPTTTGIVDDEGVVATGSWVEYDVTALVSGNGTYTFRLATTSTNSVDFHSREASQTTLRPQLVVTFG